MVMSPFIIRFHQLSIKAKKKKKKKKSKKMKRKKTKNIKIIKQKSSREKK